MCCISVGSRFWGGGGEGASVPPISPPRVPPCPPLHSYTYMATTHLCIEVPLSRPSTACAQLSALSVHPFPNSIGRCMQLGALFPLHQECNSHTPFLNDSGHLKQCRQVAGEGVHFSVWGHQLCCTADPQPAPQELSLCIFIFKSPSVTLYQKENTILFSL